MRLWWAYETMTLLFVSMLCCFSDYGPARLRHQLEGVSTTFPAPFQSTCRATSCRRERRPAPLDCWVPKSQLSSALRITLLIVPSSDKIRRLHLGIPVLAVVEAVESKSCEGREESRVSRFIPRNNPYYDTAITADHRLGQQTIETLKRLKALLLTQT